MIPLYLYGNPCSNALPKVTPRLKLCQLQSREAHSIDIELLARGEWRHTAIVAPRQLHRVRVGGHEEAGEGTSVAFIVVWVSFLYGVYLVPLS